MKNYRKIFTFVALVGMLATSVFAASNTKGWNDCPRGKHCSVPQCGLFADTNKNKLCDHGEKFVEKMTSKTTTGSIISVGGCSACTGCGACN